MWRRAYRGSKSKSRDLPRGESHGSVNPAECSDDGSIERPTQSLAVQVQKGRAMAMQKGKLSGGMSRAQVGWENCFYGGFNIVRDLIDARNTTVTHPSSLVAALVMSAGNRR